ncbi:MAG: HEAT repeat domain-containing protein [Chloroflexota bacterium]
MTGLTRLLSVRPAEAALVGQLAALFAIVEAARGVGEIGVDTLVLGQLGPGALPYLYVALGLTSLVATLALGAAVGRLPRGRLFVALLLVLAGVLAVERVALSAGSAAVIPVVWLTAYVAGALVGTLLWAIAGWVLDARQAKRLFPLCASAAILGGFVGMIGAGPLARLAGVDNLVLVQAALLAGAAWLTRRVSRSGRTRPSRRTTTSLAAELRIGFDYVRQSRLMRLIAFAYVLFAILLFSVTYPFLSAMTEAFPAEADLATALGLLSAATTAVSFLTAIALANRLNARFGIATVALVLPIVYLAGFGAWLVRFNLVTAVGFRFVQQVTQRGVSNAIWSAFYNVVPAERRAQVLAFMDGVPGQLGITIAGLLLLAASDLLTQTATFVIGAVAALAAAWIVGQIRRAYTDSLLRTLREGLAEQLLEGGPGLIGLARDPKVVSVLRAGLSEPNPGVRRLSAELLGRLGANDAAAELFALVDDPDPAVRAAAVRASAALGRPLTAEAADRLARDPNPIVRAALAIALARAGDPDRPPSILRALVEGPTPAERIAGLDALAELGDSATSSWVMACLTDPSAAVRGAAIRALAAGAAAADDPVPILIGALADPAEVVRVAAARAIAERGGEAQERTLAVLLTGDEATQDAVLRAMEGHGDEVQSGLVPWALGQVDRATTLRRWSKALARVELDPDGEAGQTVAFLQSILAGRGAHIERRLVHALAILGAPDDGGLIRRCLGSDDAEIRAMAIEALDSLGDRRLRRAVVDLLESEPDERRSDTVEMLESLVEDPDPWIRAIASRVLAQRGAGGQVPATTATLDEIGRMLVLRRIPLFGELAPEDLQRIASSAVEHLYPDGEALMREGEPGDELIVIVEGTVRVIRSDGQVIRAYGPGDHIGELAVLREAPRAATVVADAGGVRGLTISGAGLKAILRERPEAAMAMLATLAERIGTA